MTSWRRWLLRVFGFQFSVFGKRKVQKSRSDHDLEVWRLSIKFSSGFQASAWEPEKMKMVGGPTLGVFRSVLRTISLWQLMAAAGTEVYRAITGDSPLLLRAES